MRLLFSLIFVSEMTNKHILVLVLFVFVHLGDTSNYGVDRNDPGTTDSDEDSTTESLPYLSDAEYGVEDTSQEGTIILIEHI